MSSTNLDAILLDPADNVATALRSIGAGETIRLGTPGGPSTLTVVEPIPLCHKLALSPIAQGSAITKYGHPIGEATQSIAPGTHVHVHNLRSRRGKAGATARG